MPCCGVPSDDTLNGCGKSSDWLVVGAQVVAETGEWVMCLLTCCTGHREAVEAFQARWDNAATAPIFELEKIIGYLVEDGPVVIGHESVAG